MASSLSKLKNVIKLNSVHVEKQDVVTVQVARFGELHYEEQVHLHLRPIRRYQNCCPICRQKCSGYDYRSDQGSWW